MEEQQDQLDVQQDQEILPKLAVPATAPREKSAGPAVFEVRNTSIYYSAFRAVTDVSLTVHENEITAFIGPSGCGKTT
jgi:phosphate transport system ATP-binding protein